MTPEQEERIEREWALTSAAVAPIKGMLVGAVLFIIALPIAIAFAIWS